MTDGRIPGKWMNEPRFIEMDVDAWCVFTKAIAWSNEAGTDGFIKWRYLSLLHPAGDHPSANAELVELGLWAKTPTGYQLLDWDKPAHQGGLGQSTAEQVRTAKDVNRKRQQRFRERKAAEQAAATGDVTRYVTRPETGDVGQDRTGHAQMTKQLGSEQQEDVDPEIDDFWSGVEEAS